MKTVALIMSILLHSTVVMACTEKVDTKPATEPPAQVQQQPEERRVCIMVYDARQRKDVEKCKTLKIHKKYEGTKIPGQ